MADEKIVLDINVNAADSVKTVSELKQLIKDAKNNALEFEEGSKEFAEFARQAGIAKNKLDDINEAANALHPEKIGQAFTRVGSTIASGFQAAQGAMALFGNESEDVQKALLKVQAATAFAQGIQSITSFKEAFAAFNLVVKANPVLAFITAISALAIAVEQVYDKFIRERTESEKLTEQIQKQKEANKLLTTSIDAEIIAISGLAENEGKILELKRKKIQLTIDEARLNLELAQSKANENIQAATEISLLDKFLGVISGAPPEIVSLSRATNGLKESRDELQKQTQALTLAEAQLSQFNNEQQQKTIDGEKNKNEEYLRLQMERNKEANKNLEEFNSIQIGALNTVSDNISQIVEQTADGIGKSYVSTIEKINAFQEEYDQQAKDSASITSSLGELFIRDQKKLEKFRKAQAIVQLGVDTAKAISGAVAQAQSVPYPGNIFAIISGVAAVLANIVKAKQILSNSGGGGGDGPTIPSSATSSATNGVNITPQAQNTTTQINPNEVENNGGQLLKAYVVESEITGSQNQQNKIKNLSIIE